MNNVSLIGRLTADPELKHTQSNITTTRFCIAVERRFVKQGEEKQVDFISVVAWRQTAEFICKYFSKGNRIAINGRITTGSYTDQNGNKRYTFEVTAENAEFCESKNSSFNDSRTYDSYQENYQQPSQAQTTHTNDYSNGDTGDFIDMSDDEELPF